MTRKVLKNKKLQCKVGPETAEILGQIKWGMQTVFIEHAIQLAFENSKFKEWFIREKSSSTSINQKDS